MRCALSSSSSYCRSSCQSSSASTSCAFRNRLYRLIPVPTASFFNCRIVIASSSTRVWWGRFSDAIAFDFRQGELGRGALSSFWGFRGDFAASIILKNARSCSTFIELIALCARALKNQMFSVSGDSSSAGCSGSWGSIVSGGACSSCHWA